MEIWVIQRVGVVAMPMGKPAGRAHVKAEQNDFSNPPAKMPDKVHGLIPAVGPCVDAGRGGTKPNPPPCIVVCYDRRDIPQTIRPRGVLVLRKFQPLK